MKAFICPAICCRLTAALAITGVFNCILPAADKTPDVAWPPERITQAEQALGKMKADGLLTAEQARKKQALLAARRAGTFKSTALSTNNPPLNFIQNGGFEELNKNSARNRSRWLWWGGWSWGGDYENFWEERPQYVHSGQYSAGIRCMGQPGRIGISTPKLPMVPGATAYHFTVWAKGEGDNQLFLNFESGATGTLRPKIGAEWTEVLLKGKPEPGAKEFTFYIYVTGRGTIYLDDAKLVPEGGTLE